MWLFDKPGLHIVWRNPAMPHGTAREIHCDTVPGGKKYLVLERACHGHWLVVSVLTVVDGRRTVAA